MQLLNSILTLSPVALLPISFATSSHVRSFKDLILNNPLHPERNLFHPFFHLQFQFLSLPLLRLENVLLTPDQIGVSVSLGCPGNPETLRLIREVRIAALTLSITVFRLFFRLLISDSVSLIYAQASM